MLSLLRPGFDTTKTVNEALAGQIAVIGENMKIRRFQQVEEANGFVASYTHMGGKIGVLVDVETDVVNDAVKEMARKYVEEVAKANGAKITIKGFVRYETGEGIEKKRRRFCSRGCKTDECVEICRKPTNRYENENPCKWCVNAILQGFLLCSAYKSYNGYCI